MNKPEQSTWSEGYDMDSEGQLTGWNRNALKTFGWTLDARGNWTSVSEDSTETDTRIHSAMNEILTRNGTAFTYDGIGNLLTDDKGRTLIWTADGLLKSVVNADGSSATLTYDGQRRLVKMVDKNVSGITTNSVEYLWNGWQLAQEVRNGVETRTYVYGNYIDDAVAVKVVGGSTPGSYYYHRGINYTTQVITNDSGGIVEGYKSKPYGEYSVVLPGADGKLGTADDDYTHTESTIENSNVFQGLPIAIGDFLYARNRIYSVELGRFISRDPAGVFANPGFNLYQSFDLNPMMNRDPWGLISIDFPEGTLTLDIKNTQTPNRDRYGVDVFGTWTKKPKSCQDCEQIRWLQLVKTNRPKCGKKLNAWYIDHQTCDENSPFYNNDESYSNFSENSQTVEAMVFMPRWRRWNASPRPQVASWWWTSLPLKGFSKKFFM